MQMNRKLYYDPWLLFFAISLICIGLVMVTSASIAIAENQQHVSIFYYSYRQMIGMSIGLMGALIVSFLPLRFWENLATSLMLLSAALLILLLIPGISREVNGSLRWLFIGPISIQVSEFAKFALVIYFASFIHRRSDEVRKKLSGFVKPMGLLAVFSLLLLLEPDFGAAVVITGTVMGMLFLGGVPFTRFLALFIFVLGALALVSVASPYRMSRLTAFLNPWADQFNTGYQLTQSLIAFGRGGFWGAGLGNSIQKLLYLPEAHTDFLYAVLAEELGLIGALIVLIFFALLIDRTLKIGRRAILNEQNFAGFVAYGIALWLGLQTLINIGVNVGALPTKGLTLPLMSYGSSSMIMGLISLGLLFRIDFETRLKECKVNTNILPYQQVNL